MDDDESKDFPLRNGTNHYNTRRGNRYGSERILCCKKIKVALWIAPLAVGCIIVLVLLVFAIDAIKPDTPKFKSDNTGTVLSLKTDGDIQNVDDFCYYRTPQNFLETLPDNLSEYCKPTRRIMGVFHADMEMCPGGMTHFHFPRVCLCYIDQPCLGGKRRRKQPCKACTAKRQCPCQNGGACRCASESSHSDELYCVCKPGTSGKYCTKITQRKCRLNRTITEMKLPNCNISNQIECFTQEPNKKTYFYCKWSASENTGQCSDCFSLRKEQTDRQHENVLTGKYGKANDSTTEETEAYYLKDAVHYLYASITCIALIIVVCLPIILYKLCKQKRST